MRSQLALPPAWPPARPTRPVLQPQTASPALVWTECACVPLCLPMPARLTTPALPAGTVDLAAVPPNWSSMLPVIAPAALRSAWARSVGNSALVKRRWLALAPARCMLSACPATARMAAALILQLPIARDLKNVLRATSATATPAHYTSHWAQPVTTTTPSACPKPVWPTNA